MTIISLNIYIAIVAIVLTWVASKKAEIFQSWFDSFLQNFCGALFIFSGFVKAVDPMGTAYKMEEYFKEFEQMANGSFLAFMADLFPFMLQYAVGFSVTMIVLEIVVGIALIIGSYKKLTAWLFFLIMVFFTKLTGYTFLTGYVPQGVNFFEFSSWGDWDKTLMRVQNCGCFGDFLKLDPRTSFLKDVFLMIPAILFLFRYKSWHSFFSPSIRKVIMALSIAGFLLFCLTNFVWREPMIDFRPFAIGTDVRTAKENEMEAMAKVSIVGWKLRNRNSGEIKDLSDADYMGNLASYPKTDWEVLDQIKSEPSIPITKISDFVIYDLEGNDVTYKILDEERSQLMINCPKMYFTSRSESVMRSDTVYRNDTIWDKSIKDSFQVTRTIEEIKQLEEKRNVYTWDQKFLNLLKNKILPLADSLKNDGLATCLVAGGTGEEALKDLIDSQNLTIPVYTADDILLKTIMRSNPGLILWRNGKIIYKWHYAALPEASLVRRDYLR
ncbi:MAG: DoxX family protein [Saprospiraceae bacterium]|nr:DoxX family protein [Saprospiraceae bacterium]